MNIPKFFDIAIFRHNGRFSVTAECIVAIMHDRFEVIRHISTVDAYLVVFIESKSVVYEKRENNKLYTSVFLELS